MNNNQAHKLCAYFALKTQISQYHGEYKGMASQLTDELPVYNSIQ